MQNTEQLDLLINVLTRAKNCDKALLILKMLLQNLLFDKEKFDRYGMDKEKCIKHIHDQILKAVELIENG